MTRLAAFYDIETDDWTTATGIHFTVGGADANAVHFNESNDTLTDRYLDVPTNDVGPSGFGQQFFDESGSGINIRANAPGLKFAIVRAGGSGGSAGQILLFASDNLFMHSDGSPTLSFQGTIATLRLFTGTTYRIVDSDGTTVLQEFTGT